MSVQLLKGETDDCHLVTLPVAPLSVRVPLADPEQIVDPPAMLPPADGASTATVAAAELAEAHEPF
jgi:hypothetical protein